MRVVQISSPFRGFDDDLHANGFEVLLDDFGNFLAVRHVRTGYRHRIEDIFARQAVWITRFR
ncbi:hypothetical protein D3C76_1692710 [compost metagenome]